MEYLSLRWRPRILAAKDAVGTHKRNYYLWRLPVVLGAVILPSLTNPTVQSPWARWAALVVSLVVAAATGVENLFRFGNRWRLYRQLLDEQRYEGWACRFAVGAYRTKVKPVDFAIFVRRTEDIIRRYCEEYVTDVLVLVASRKEEEQRNTPEAANE